MSAPLQAGRRGAVSLAALLASGAGCQSPTVVGIVGTTQTVPVRLAPLSAVDLLVVVDNSPSMAGKQEGFASALRASAPLLQAWGRVHIAAITTDLGAGLTKDTGCRVGGDGATLRAVGAAAPPSCKGVTSGNFLDLDFVANTNNLAGGSLDEALACLVAAGNTGCPFEQPLEAAYTALTARMPGGASASDGFLRDDALLVVLFLTDEDDCSAAPGTDLFDPAKTSMYGPLTSYRCARAGMRWGVPAMPLPEAPTGGPLTMPSATRVVSASLGDLTPISRYESLFGRRAPTGIKADPNEVILAAFAGPPELELIAAPLSVEPVADPGKCAGSIDGVNCALALKHGCVASSDNSKFADPALRLSTVLTSVSHHYFAPLCETDHKQALGDLVGLVRALEASDGCLGAPLADEQSPDCTVIDVTTQNGVEQKRTIAACAQPAQKPCWQIVEDATCAPVLDPRTGVHTSRKLVIDRGSVATTPPGTVTTAHCASL